MPTPVKLTPQKSRKSIVTLRNVLNSDEKFKEAMKKREKTITRQPVLVPRSVIAHTPKGHGRRTHHTRRTRRQSRKSRR
jgi:hypothetical protein